MRCVQNLAKGMKDNMELNSQLQASRLEGKKGKAYNYKPYASE
jgi:hypothetical protein